MTGVKRGGSRRPMMSIQLATRPPYFTRTYRAVQYHASCPCESLVLLDTEHMEAYVSYRHRGGSRGIYRADRLVLVTPSNIPSGGYILNI